MKKLVFTALAAVFMLSSGFTNSNFEADDFGCMCSVRWYEYHEIGDTGIYLQVIASASANTTDGQACNQWARELNTDREVISASYNT